MYPLEEFVFWNSLQQQLDVRPGAGSNQFPPCLKGFDFQDLVFILLCRFRRSRWDGPTLLEQCSLLGLFFIQGIVGSAVLDALDQMLLDLLL